MVKIDVEPPSELRDFWILLCYNSSLAGFMGFRIKKRLSNGQAAKVWLE